MSERYDLIVVGGGPGGYVAAIRAAQLGFKVALVEKEEPLGGTCTNVGCIPSKALLDSSELYHQAKQKGNDHGLEFVELKVNLKTMMRRKADVVAKTRDGLNYLINKNKITRFTGHGSFIDSSTIQVLSGREKTKISGSYIVIATGSEPTELPFASFDEKRVLSSTGALELQKLPKHLIVIGGGVIGLEIGSVYGRLGSKITVIEFLDSIISTLDRQLGKALQKSLKAINFEFHLGTKVTGINVTKQGVVVTAENAKGKSFEFSADHVLVAIGRRPYTEGLGLTNAGIEVDEVGRIKTDKNLRTTCENVYAVGDVVAGPMLAHKAEEEGVAVAEILAGEKPQINHDTIPGVVYTWPEVATVGKSEEELKKDSIEYKVGTFPFKASGRARAANEFEGFVKVLADAQSDEILGVHMIGPRCSDMIGEAVVAMEYKASAEDIGRIVHAHPTFTESFKEASLMATANRALHL